ncbi:MAG: serine/threonine protein kinase [Anaerolineae bacterium]
MLEQNAMLQDRYRIVRVLGGGGMGQVYLAHDTRLADKPCAVKELIPDPHATPEEAEQAAAQFHHEAAILAHLSHPNLPDVSDYFEERGHFYLVMDFIEGETPAEQLSRSPGGLPQEMVVKWAIQLCDVLEYLHSQTPPVIFRDMKPANVMITPEGEVKLIDFGVARLFDPSKRTDTLKMGTAGYAPPEQYAGQGQTTPRSDVYALGATLYELLTGDDPTAHPFVFTPPRKLNPGISPSLSNAIMRAVSLDPDDRFPSVRAMKETLQKVTQPRRLRLPSIQRRRGAGTKVMAETAAVPAWRTSRPVRFALGTVRLLGRVALTILLAAAATALVLLLVAAFVLSAISERTIATADWQLEASGTGEFVLTEDEIRESMKVALEPYALDAIRGVDFDFRSPDKAVVSLNLSCGSISLQARLAEQDGVPTVILERMNNVPLYVVGGIVSGGINRGFRKAWEGSPIQVTSLTVQERQLTIQMEEH